MEIKVDKLVRDAANKVLQQTRPGKAMSDQLKYERRIIFFIDFLGFKEVVASTEHDPAELTRLVAALNAIGSVGDDKIFDSQQVSQFSDSVVMSYRVDEQSGVFWMVNEIALAVISLAERGFLLRGAVTLGDLYHTPRHVVGPAMVRAYEMESRVARYPRVIVDPAIVDLAGQHPSNDHSPDDEEGYVRKFIAEDADGQLFIDYISWDAVVAVAGADDLGYPAYLRTLSHLLHGGLSHADPNVTEKYLWLHPRYLSALDKICELPNDHPYRLENPDNCHFIEKLPRLTELAETAQEQVNRSKAAS